MQFVIDNIRSDDPLAAARARTFLLENADDGVRPRPDEQLTTAVNCGQGILVSAATKITGISLIHPYDPGPGHKVFSEIGTMLVIAEGYGLQVVLASLHLVQIWLEDDATRGDIFAVVGPATPSEHNLTHHVGMTGWVPPQLLELLRSKAGVPFAAGKPVLLADDAVIARAFATLRALHIRDNLFRTPKNEATIEVAMKWFDPQVLNHGP